MKKATFIKLLCLAIACLMLVPMIVACGEQKPDGANSNTDGSTNSSTSGSSNTDNGEKITVQFRGNGKGADFEGSTSVEINKGGKLDVTQMPSVYRDGYEFDYWAYDTKGDNQWNEGDVFNQTTILYAIWTSTGSTPGTGSSTPDTGSSTDPIDPPDNPPSTTNVTVEFNTGTGYFTDATLYEATVKVGGRLGSFPTPVHDNAAMLFSGWYKDSACTIPASLSDKYEADTMLYAYWIEQAECTDGSYNHLYSGWDVDQKADCVKPGTYARYCDYCNDKQIKVGDPALGHQFGQWQEAFMARQRTCQRLGCGEIEIENFKNVTVSVLGSKPAEQITGSTTNFYVVPFTNLINNRWDEGHGEFVGPKGNGTAYVQFNLLEPTTLDRIYFKGEGVTSINVYVQYEGEDDFTLVGICGGCSDKEDTPFVEPDSSKNILSIKFVEDNPPNGTSKWQEVAFVKVEE
ncbi:MAG: InlB B-repeat-containing protein [Clostridia bacterium]|nr:InlB B-repeat-containing protein [Clostridia bacterium]